MLVLRLSSLGDVLLLRPFLAYLAQQLGRPADLLTASEYAPLARTFPEAGEVLAWDRYGREQGWRGIWQMAQRVRSRSYGQLYDLQGKLRTRLLGLLTALPVARSSRGPALHGARRYFTAEGEGRASEWEWPELPPLKQSLFLRSRGNQRSEWEWPELPPLKIPPEAQRRAQAFLQEHALQGRPVALNPCARWGSKRWPASSYALLARRIIHELSRPVLLLGGPGEESLIDEVRFFFQRVWPGKAPLLPHTCCLDLVSLAALLGECLLLVTGDSGPMHLAAALHLPLVALFGPTSPQRWRPLTSQAQILYTAESCSPCSRFGSPRCPQKHHRCLASLSVEDVYDTVRSLAPS